MNSPGVPATVPSSLERSVRAALNELGDLGRLAASPLAAALGGPSPGLAAREVLLEAIGKLDPPAELAAGDPSRRRAYILMRERYVEGRRVADVCLRLAISETEFYRRHARAVTAVARLVAARLQAAGEAPGPPFVGRQAELSRLLAAFAEAAAGRGGRLILISGAMGVGKTRLAQQAGRQAEAMGGRFLAARYLRDAGSAYGPWVEALSRPLQEMARAARARLASPYAGLLAQLFPQLDAGTAGPDLGLLSPEDRRLQLHLGLANLLRGLGERRPLVVLCDDLHWAPGLDVLAYLASRLAEMRVLLVATLRQPEFDERPELRRVRLELAALPGAAAIEVPPLAEEDTLRLAMAGLGPLEGARVGAALHRRSRGNPFFIEAALQSWNAADPGAVPLPESVRAAVLERVARLGADGVPVLTRAAVLGARFRAADLQRLDPRPVGALLEAAVDAGLLHPLPGGYAFGDEHVHEALYESVPAPRRAALHLAVAEALQAGGTARAEDLAHHLASGGDAEAGARWSYQAGRERAASYDWEEAAFQLRRALRLWEGLGGHAAERAECCRQLGDLLFESGIERGQGSDHLLQGLALFAEAGDSRGLARTHMRLGRGYAAGHDLEDRDMGRALHHLRAARALLEAESPGDPAALCEVDIGLASAATYALDVPAALASAARAEELSRRAGDLGLQVLAGGIHGALVACAGRPRQGLAKVAGSRRAAREAGLLWHADLLATSEGFVTGILRPARLAALADRLPRAASTPSRLAWPQQVLGACAYTGAFATGAALQAWIARTLAEAGLPPFGPEPQHMVRFLARRGDWAEAEALLVPALAWARRAGAAGHLALLLQAGAELRLAQGEPAAGADSAAEAAALQRAGGFRLGLAETLATLAFCLAVAGRPDAAAAALAEARRAIAPADDWGRLPATVALAEAVAARRQGQPADGLFQNAVDGMRAEGVHWDAAMALWLWGADEARGQWAAMGAGRFADAARM